MALKTTAFLSIGFLTALTLAGCGSSSKSNGTPPPVGGECNALDFTKYPTTTTPVSFTNDVMPIFEAKCSASSCHNTMHQEADLSLGVSGGAQLDAATITAVLGNIVNTPAKTVTTGNVMRVVPNHPEQSFLVDKIDGTQNDHGYTCTMTDTKYSSNPTPCGDLMPQGNDVSLCEDGTTGRAKFDTIVNWIAQGAQSN